MFSACHLQQQPTMSHCSPTGIIVGAPTWNTGADEARSGTAWDDVLEEIKGEDQIGTRATRGLHAAAVIKSQSADYSDMLCRDEPEREASCCLWFGRLCLLCACLSSPELECLLSQRHAWALRTKPLACPSCVIC